MLRRPLIFIGLLALFVVVFSAKQSELEDKNVEEDDDDADDDKIPEQPGKKANKPVDQQSFNNIKSAVKPIESKTKNDNVNQIPVSPPASINQRLPASPAMSTSLANSPQCKGDIRRYCARSGTQFIPNMKVLQCIDDLDNAANLISKECQNHIYSFKYNMTRDIRFDDAAKNFCDKDIKLLEYCNEHTDERGTGRLVSCLFDQLSNITEPTCRNFIKQLHSVIFTDWRLSESFATACLNDIIKLKCGRLDVENATLPHEQGAVISCISQKFGQLEMGCRKQMFRIAEMQSDDYHLDRALYYSCREDRERLCSAIPGGNGRVYRCLYDQKFNNMMSAACRKEIERRQKVVVSNALTDVPLIRACNSEMREHKCVTDPKDPDRQLSLVNLLLCLEDRIKKGENVKDECRREMLVHRRMLMSDYALSPEIISDCKDEMMQHCPSLTTKGASGTIDQRGGRMIHCLLSAARKEKSFSAECLTTIKSLVRVVDPGNDIRADPLLETACRPVIDALCSRIKPGDSNIILCLLENMKNNRMTDECEDRLMEVAYFMARDWRLTPKLLRTCQKSLVDFCQLPKDWSMSKTMDDVEVGKYLSCLYQQKQKLDSECQSELKRLMSIRTQSIGLMPEIEDNCIQDLATCKNPEIKGEEMKCLQKKYDKLEDKCKAAVGKFTEITMSDASLDSLLMKACESSVQAFCSNTQGGNENDLIRCLVKYKNNPKMDYRCKAGIDHHQIISLKDKAFLSPQFQQKCLKELSEHCSNKRTKSSVIECLANLVLKDVLKKQNQINNECRDELKFELLQRSENINFDPSLAAVCQKDIRQFCSALNPGNAQVLDCLKANRNKVSAPCFAKLQKREKLDVVLPGNDYSLTSKCALAIQKFCSNEKKQNILSCLRRNINQDVMSYSCRTVLHHRLMILNSDARFNTALIENCNNDISKHCQDKVIDNDDFSDENDDENPIKTDDNNVNANPNEDSEVKDRDMGGRVIECLRTKYANTHVELEPKCMTELIDIIQTSKLDIKLDVQLYQKCRNLINSECIGIDKEDCLKVKFQQNKITDTECREQVIRIIKEGRADIHVDSTLAIACQTDVYKYCNDVPIGSGKQLKCLLKKSKQTSKQCKNILLKRQELWSGISDIDGFDDLTRHIVNSENNQYIYAILLLIALGICFAGCLCRSCARFSRVRKYK